MLNRFGPVSARGEILEIEDFVSGLLGALATETGPDSAGAIGEFIEQVAGRRTDTALGLLRGIGALGPTIELRAAAAAGADVLAATRAEPPWAPRLAEAAFVESWRLGDVYGDQATLLCVFERSGERHGLVVSIDFNHLGGWVEDITPVDNVEEVLPELRRAALASNGVLVFGSIAPDEARRLVEDGIAATEMTIDAQTGEGYSGYRTLALARCRIMPGPAVSVEVTVPDAERDAIVESFLAAGVTGTPDADAVRYLARLLVDYGCDYDGGQPLRVGPAKLETFLLGYLPRKVVLDDTDRAALPDVISEFCSWAAEQSQLPPAARDELADVVAQLTEDFTDVYDDAANASPARAMLADLDPDVDLSTTQATMERRMFAMPYFGTRIGDEDFPRLDPNDDDERHLLVVGEHPEFHAAQRLQAQGMERLDVTHALGGVLTEHVWNALDRDEPVDPEAYPRALDALAAPSAKRPGRSRRKAGTSAAEQHRIESGVVQLKVTLRWSKPPIWRRLRVPVSTTLAQLHDVIQAAFGWEDEHLHVFEVDGERYAPREFQLDFTKASDRVRLSTVCSVVGLKMRYEYDFGDSWTHDIVVEQAGENDGVRHAVCLAGRRAGPVEDCGGIGGWEYLCEILADPSHPDYEERLEWLGHVPDPAAFDLAAVNQALARLELG